MKNKKNGKGLRIGGEYGAASSHECIERDHYEGGSKRMKFIGQHAEWVGKDQGTAIGQSEAFPIKAHVHGETFGEVDAEVVYADKGNPRKSNGDEDPEVVGFTEAFVKVGACGDKEIPGTFLGLRRG